MITFRKIIAYIFPFIIFLIFSLSIEYIGSIIFDTNILMNKYLLDVINVIICSITFVLSGFYIAPKKVRKNTIKILSIILCALFLLAILADLKSQLQNSTYIAAILSAIITFLILNKSKRDYQ